MASLKALKIRIGSVKSTQKITKAMQMVAAAKLKRAQLAAEAGRPYAERIEQVVASLAARVTISDQTPKLLAGNGHDQVHLLIVTTSERGLAGAFNSNIIRAARRKAEELIAQGKTVKILTVGKKGRVLKRFYPKNMLGDIEMGGIKNVAFADAQKVADEVIQRFGAGEFDVAHLFYAKFQSALVQEPMTQQVIPVPVDANAAGSTGAVEYEPEAAQLQARVFKVEQFGGREVDGDLLIVSFPARRLAFIRGDRKGYGGAQKLRYPRDGCSNFAPSQGRHLDQEWQN